MSLTTNDKPKAAQRIQEAAKELFYRQGIRATGVEEVCRAADATKMSLYRNYPSKDALVCAILEDCAEEYEAWFQAAINGADGAAGKLRALVAAAATKIGSSDDRGCPLLLAQAEFPDPEHPTHKLVVRFKSEARRRYAALAAEAGAQDPALLADTLLVLWEGAWSALAYMGRERAAQVLRDTAETLLTTQLNGSG
ncbi:MAG TPA: TetR/AcrR family transcriptional regulator [Acetobacteraceae bacterium]|nr:TetR/AcrR family transcriptional regulator [Acetobacteraceae bacterium]